MLNRKPIRNAQQAGFSLVELMVAMVLGLIVIGAVIALVLSMMRANNQTIQSTRLTQELRATAALMAADIRRAGGVADPMTSATANAGQPDTTMAAITVPAAPSNNCIKYAYADAEGGNFHTISVSNAGAVLFAAGGASPACQTGIALSSPQVEITGLQFARLDGSGAANANGRNIRITMAGRLRNNTQIGRTYTQDVYIRSALP